jgi:hypothetical protein
MSVVQIPTPLNSRYRLLAELDSKHTVWACGNGIWSIGCMEDDPRSPLFSGTIEEALKWARERNQK